MFYVWLLCNKNLSVTEILKNSLILLFMLPEVSSTWKKITKVTNKVQLAILTCSIEYFLDLFGLKEYVYLVKYNKYQIILIV